MLDFVFRLMLTTGATFWMVIVFGIKEHWTLCIFPAEVIGIALMMVPIALSGIAFLMSRFFNRDSIQNCTDCVLADNDFLPVYLGYFFVALSINDSITLCFVYAIVFIFTFITQTQYFNPLFLLFGYHFYHVVTLQGTQVFLIVKGKVIRNVQDVKFTDMRRLNDTTYIVRKDKRE
jgi:hypothetical protein